MDIPLLPLMPAYTPDDLATAGNQYPPAASLKT